MNKSQNGYLDNIEKETEENSSYRKVLYTGEYSQLVLMSLKPGEEIGKEIHKGHDQFFRIESGEAEVLIGDETMKASADDAIIVPSGVEHNVTNVSETEDLRLYTIYSPAEHADGLEQVEKPEEN